MFVSCDCSVLSGRNLCVGLITRPEESSECGVPERDHKSSIVRRSWPNRCCCAMVKNSECCKLNFSYYTISPYFT